MQVRCKVAVILQLFRLIVVLNDRTSPTSVVNDARGKSCYVKID